jgi:hypothetical protein
MILRRSASLVVLAHVPIRDSSGGQGQTYIYEMACELNFIRVIMQVKTVSYTFVFTYTNRTCGLQACHTRFQQNTALTAPGVM